MLAFEFRKTLARKAMLDHRPVRADAAERGSGTLFMVGEPRVRSMVMG
jgi:hypothetical protein